MDIQARVDQLAEWLGMGHWDITVSKEPASKDEFAHIELLPHDAAVIRVSHHFYDLPETKQTMVLLHELLHPEVTRVHECLRRAIDIQMEEIPKGRKVTLRKHMKVHEDAAEHREEVLVNKYAKLLTPFAPPPPV